MGFVLLNQCCRSLVFFLLVIVLSIVLKFIASDYPFVIFWLPLCYLLIAPLISWLPLCYLLITPLISSDYPFDIFWLPLWYLLITPLLSSDYPFDIFWLPLWYLLITPMVSSNFAYPSRWRNYTLLQLSDVHLIKKETESTSPSIISTIRFQV